ncbi:MAG: TlpA disulfide reductase family protein, partial [Bacteroidota bacterium]
IEDYRDSQYTKLENHQATLNPGNKAADFYLSDQNGKFHRLSDFLGKVIYVNFWTTSCSPCLASIPEKNLLVEEFSDHPFELLNICLFSKPELWSSIIEDRDFAGTHLICKGNWSSRLRDQYLIQSFPQYALIDSEGKIITNKCEKPEDIVDQLRTMLY